MNYIGIPTINNLKYLQETVESLQSKYPFKLLIIDNNSTDNTRQWMRDTQEYFDIDVILNDSNLGVSKSWNQIINWALSHSDCETIFILNNDIVLADVTLDLLIEDLVNHGLDATSGVNIGNHPSMLKSWKVGKEKYSTQMNFSCFALSPRTVKRIGFFDEGFELAYFEDNDYHYRMQLEGLDKRNCNMWAPFVHYGSRTIREGGVRHEPFFTKNKEYFKKKWGFLP